VLIFPSGTEIGLEIYKSLKLLKEVEIFGASSVPFDHSDLLLKNKIHIPTVNSSGWIEKLNQVIKTKGIQYIFPAHDDVLLALSKERENILAKIFLSPSFTCTLTRSKRKTYAHLQSHVKVPREIKSAQEVSSWPIFCKPDVGQGSQSAFKVMNTEELNRVLEDPRMLALEYLPGREFTVDCFSDRERGLLYCRARERKQMKTGIATWSAFDDRKIFKEFAETICKQLEFHGTWFFQVKENGDGELTLLEIAPRIAGTMSLSRVTGVNFPLLNIFEYERLPFEISAQKFPVEIHRSFQNRYKHNLKIQKLYIDFDDTLLTRQGLNSDLVKLIIQFRNQKKRVELVTRHAGNLKMRLEKLGIRGLFHTIHHLKKDAPKSKVIKGKASALIDDSFSERMEVHLKRGIPVFDPSMIELLFDERI